MIQNFGFNRTLRLFIVGLGIILSSPSSGLPPDVLARLKAATVFIKVQVPGGSSQGSGFIFRRDADAGYIMTNAHVVADGSGPARYSTVVFNSGQPEERIFNRAEIVAFDDIEDVAVIKVLSNNLPEPIEIPERAEPHETMPVFILGFPFGEGLSMDEGNPSITVSQGSVSSLRRSNNVLIAVQISGDINHGNSGGPVVDGDGRLIGMAVAKIEQTQIGFAIPSENLFIELKGHTVRTNLVGEEITSDKITCKVTLHLFDPFHNIESAAVLITPKDKFTLSLERDTSQEQRAQAAQGMPTFELPIVDSEAVGSLTVQRGEWKNNAVEYVVMTKQVDREGVATYTQPFSFSIPRPADGSDLGTELKTSSSSSSTSIETIDPQAMPIIPPPLQSDLTTVRLPSLIYDLDTGGGGRFIVLYLKEIRKLAVFDLNSARVARYISLPAGEIVFAAGGAKICVIQVDENLYQRYDLLTGRMEFSKKLPFPYPVVRLGLGARVLNTALLIVNVSDEQVHLLRQCSFDIMTATIGECDNFRENPDYASSIHLRASANGQLYGTWNANGGRSITALIWEESVYKTYQNSERADHIIPDADGELLFTSNGVYTRAMKRVMSHLGKPYILIPANRGHDFMGVKAEESGDLRKALSLEFFIPNRQQPVYSMPVQSFMPGNDPWRLKSDFTMDKRYHYLPEAGVVIVIPDTDDQLVLMRFDLKQKMKEAGIGYLYVVPTTPPPALKGKMFSYQVQVESNAEGLHFSLDAAPEGMKINSQGLITWKVPADWDGPSSEFIIVNIADDSGQTAAHSFEMRIK